MSCFVRGCKSVRRFLTPESKISFHRFPTEIKPFLRWLHAIGRGNEDVTWSPSRFICSKHFRPDDIYVVAKKHYLKIFALPVLYLPGSEKVASSSMLLPSAASQNVIVMIESSESDLSISRIRKRIMLEHNYSRKYRSS